VSFLLGVNGTVAQAEAPMTPLGNWVKTVPQYLSIIGADFEPFASLMQFHEYFDDSSEATGYAGTLGSRIIPLDIARNDSARLAVALALTEITFTTGSITGMLVAGGAVASADPGSAETSINPAWRSALAHVAFGASWPLNASLAEQAQYFGGVSALAGLLASTTDGNGRGPAAYWSESDYLEADWQQAFWGKANYARLQAVKKAVDPAGLFSCHHCVELPAE